MNHVFIPKFAQPGQPHAFANREKELLNLYKAIVAAGNAVRAGRRDVRRKLVVLGYMGVGKSALILQALAMVQGHLPPTGASGQRTLLPPTLPPPVEPHRWLILRISGKHHATVDGITDAVRTAALTAIDEGLGKDPVFSFLADVAGTAQAATQSSLQLPLLHRLFRTRESKLFEQVRQELLKLAQTVSYVRAWQGSRQVDKGTSESSIQSGLDAEARIEAEIKGQVGPPTSVEARAALQNAVKILRKVSDLSQVSSQVERSFRVGSELVVETLNSFFTATNAAGLPTVLVLDDFDEFTSVIGPSHEDRSRILSLVLGPIGRLAPTCLVLGLRQEYEHEDVARVFEMTQVRPMNKEAALRAIEAWAEVQDPPLDKAELAHLTGLGGRVLRHLPDQRPSVVPFRLLPLLIWLSEEGVDPSGPETEDRALLESYLDITYYPDARDALMRASAIMPEADILRCAGALPLSPEPYAFTEDEQRALTQAGLLRPAIAGDPRDRHILLDPLTAWLRLMAR